MALPLTRYLDGDAEYVGMDVVAPAIRWCRRNISRRHPRFTFQHADLKNARYNPSGRFTASQYRFPFHDGSFDFVFLTSVFTHMRPDEIECYLLEIARLLRPSGHLLCTFFLLNPTQRALAAAGKATVDFRWDHGTFRTRDQALPESAIAVDEEVVRIMLTHAGLDLGEPVRYGTWSGRQDGLSLQDIVLARRPAGGTARRE
jgi:SAM-dependent methyltransferase